MTTFMFLHLRCDFVNSSLVPLIVHQGMDVVFVVNAERKRVIV
jgi:hypothetical protein